NGSFIYQPNAGATGSDTFTYRASDGTAQSQPATVTINVTSGGSGAGEGESIASMGAGDAALLAYLTATDDDEPARNLALGDSPWQDAVDEAFAALA
ncbi:MAG TPA: Ig-like domain-containing protein, partial [Aestuariivirgaceae bacterium]|nr:Ig-like domain-containing protein [Aestuariivirgaceae bacterium]